MEAIDRLVELGAQVEADPYRGTPLAWAASKGRAAAIRRLAELGADPNGRGTFGGPTHGEGVAPIDLAAQAGQEEAIDVLLKLGADPTIRDALYDGTAAGWAAHGCRPDLAERLG
jgi:ankyrin repeat protein